MDGETAERVATALERIASGARAPRLHELERRVESDRAQRVELEHARIAGASRFALARRDAL